MVGHPIIIRKKNKGNSAKYYDYCLPLNGEMYFEQNYTLPEQSIELNTPDYTYGVFDVWIGGQKTELLDQRSSVWNPFGISVNNTFKYATIRDSESFQYIIFRMSPKGSGQGVITDFQSFMSWFTSNLSSAEQIIAPIDLPTVSGTDSQGYPRQWGTRGNIRTGFVTNYTTNNNLACYPYILEYRGTSVKITTYSEKAPNTTVANNQVGTEDTKISVTSSHTLRLYNTNDMSSYCNKLSTAANNYSLKFPDNQALEFGFLCVYRGARSTAWTPKNHMRWFLNRVTNIDTTNDWTHVQLT